MDSNDTNTDTFSFTIDNDKLWLDTADSTITINTDYSSTGTFTYDTSTVYSNTDVSWNLTGDFTGLDGGIWPGEVERMCKEYPALEKVWRNFKNVYDLCKQDYEGKKKSGELNDDIPF